MNKKIVEKFNELKVIGDRSKVNQSIKQEKDTALICFLKDLIISREVADFEDIGFCYWNISDNYALLNKGNELYRNHIDFYNYIKTFDSKYLFWLVSDATQRFTLEKNGYYSFWWELYRKSVNENKSKSCLAEFYAHRTAISLNPIMPHDKENLIFVINAIDNFLKNQINNIDFQFYNTIFKILKSRHLKETEEIINISTPYLSKLKSSIIKSNYLSGEWKGLDSVIPEQKQAGLILNSAINCLIDAEKTENAKNLYTMALNKGMPKNRYIESRL